MINILAYSFLFILLLVSIRIFQINLTQYFLLILPPLS